MTQTKQTAAYGSWKSPISAGDVATAGVRFGHMAARAGRLYWSENRPEEKGRGAIMSMQGAQCVQLSGQEFNVRSRVHEMGGGEFAVLDERVVFCNDNDQCLYLLENGSAKRLTPLPTDAVEQRFTDMDYDQERQWLVAVREVHEGTTVTNDIVTIALDGSESVISLVSGFDFFSFPRISLDGSQLLWTCWNQPQMPWDGTELWLGDIENGLVVNIRKIAGGPNESIYQPSWGIKDEIYYVSDRSGWWNILCLEQGRTKEVCVRENDFGLPQWIFGTSTYGLTDDGRLVTRYQDFDRQVLCYVDLATGEVTLCKTSSTYFGESLVVAGHKVYYYGASANAGEAIVEYDLNTQQEKILRESGKYHLDAAFVSNPEAVECDSDDRKTFGFYYPPTNPNFKGLTDTVPPLLVMSHGGPTAATHPTFNLAIQYWTTRGIGVVDVNYGGSTGYGREYRRSLNNNWGLVDVDDCINMANYLVSKNKADRDKLMIRGGSAGGYTTLCALTFHDVFAVGCSRYGIADLSLLASDTHKFEARYLDQLVGDFEKEHQTYIERSPINYLEQLSCPIILQQGLEDKIVPPSQSEAMVQALNNNNLPYAYVTFANEQHGFRQSNNIIRALESEYYFYGKILGFKTDVTIDSVDIKNLPD